MLRADPLLASIPALVAAVLALPAPASACSCVQPPPPSTALEQASAVFEARVARVEVDSARLRMTAHLIVIRQWKGDLPEDVTVTTASQGSLCGFPFVADQRVLLYVDGEIDAMSVSMCSRSRPMEQAGEDLAALLDLPVSGPRRPAAANGSGGAGPGGGGGGTPRPGGGGHGATTPAPRSGGCGGCGGASLAGVGLVVAAGTRRRRNREI
jgi:hypothetical protein